jgi:hypothetical protein
MTKTGHRALLTLAATALGLAVLVVVWSSLSARSADARDAAERQNTARSALAALTLPSAWATPVASSGGCVTGPESRCWTSDASPQEAAALLQSVQGWEQATITEGRSIPGSGGTYILKATVDGTSLVASVEGRKVTDPALGDSRLAFAGSQIQALVNQGDS